MTENCDGGIGIWKIWTAEFGITPNFERFFGGMAELPTLEITFSDVIFKFELFFFNQGEGVQLVFTSYPSNIYF